MMPVWLLYVKKSSDFKRSVEIPALIYVQVITSDNCPANINYKALTQPRHKDDKESTRAVITSIGHLRGIFIVASSFGRLVFSDPFAR
jgi:hypothetical protein